MPFEGNRLGNSHSTRDGRLCVYARAMPPERGRITTLMGLFGKFERYSIGVSFVLAFLVMRYLGPTMQEIQDHREKKIVKMESLLVVSYADLHRDFLSCHADFRARWSGS